MVLILAFSLHPQCLIGGEKEKILTVKVEAPEADVVRYLEKKIISRDNAYTTPVIKEAIEDQDYKVISIE